MESPETRLIGETIRDALARECDSSEPIRVARAELLHHVTLGARRREFPLLAYVASRPWRFAALLGAAACAFGAWLWLGRPISFDVGAGSIAGRIGDVVQAQSGEPLPLRFSEGSSILLHDGGRVRVLAADAAGARVLLENGEADVAIAHRTRRSTRWSFEAGPFHVLVTGTKFKVAWNAAKQAISVATNEGSVLVSAPCLDAPRAVRKGDRAELSCHKTTRVPDAAGLVAAANAQPNPSPSQNPNPNLLTPLAPARSAAQRARLEGSTDPGTSAPAPASDDSWRAPLRAGLLAEALRAAESAGFGAVCEQASSAELLSLADAARLSGSAARATEALRALRRRFPHSGEAATAAFALGRIAFDQRADYADAARWFKTYLDQLPNGPLMGDAAGRLMQARSRQGDRSAARAEAESYLRRFPLGPYASEARRIISE